MALNTSLGTRRSAGAAREGRQVRTGGPRRPSHGSARYEQVEMFRNGVPFGSHMPLDAEPHWRWNNPLNILPATILVLLLLALLSLVAL
jgi:hypothetical protein